jgi:hypothetical protein
MGVDEARARFLVVLIEKYTGKNDRILEVGSREGDNLVSLWKAGFKNLAGIEDNVEKVAVFNERHDEIAERIDVTVGHIEDLVHGLPDEAFDVVLTVGFLFDRKGDYAWLSPELARICSRRLVSIEYESPASLKGAYEKSGRKEIEAIDISAVTEMNSVFYARVFEKVNPS